MHKLQKCTHIQSEEFPLAYFGWAQAVCGVCERRNQSSRNTKDISHMGKQITIRRWAHQIHVCNCLFVAPCTSVAKEKNHHFLESLRSTLLTHGYAHTPIAQLSTCCEKWPGNKWLEKNNSKRNLGNLVYVMYIVVLQHVSYVLLLVVACVMNPAHCNALTWNLSWEASHCFFTYSANHLQHNRL